LGAVFLVLSLSFAEGDTLLLRNARVVIVSGATLPQADVLVEDGVIRAVGEKLEAPPGAKRIDLYGRTLTPGFIDCASYLGLYYEREETLDAVTPELTVLDAFAPKAPSLLEALRAGVTTVHLVPGEHNAVGGLTAIVKLDRSDGACRVLEPRAGLGVSLTDAALLPLREPTTRPDLEDLLRRAFSAAEAGSPLAEARQERLPVWIQCDEVDQLQTALALAGELRLHVRLLGPVEAHRIAARLREAEAPVVLPTFQRLDGAVGLNGIAELAQAGVRLAFGSWTPVAAADDLRTTAALAVWHGLPRDQALRALTLDAAQILGIADRTGSVEPGKQADLVVWNGDPLDLTSRVERVFVEGRVVYGEASP